MYDSAPLIHSDSKGKQPVDQWVPIPLRPAFWVPLVSLMAAGGIAFEVALLYSNRNHGM
jgi:hypothetical protein